MGIVFFMLLNASSTGFCSDAFEPIGDMKVVGDVTREVTIGNIPRTEKNKIFSKNSKTAENWVQIGSCSFNGRIKNNGSYYAKVDGSGLTPFLPDNNLTSTALQAIDAVPGWLKVPLLDNLARLGSSTQDVYANLILTSPALWQDEVAFVIARIDSEMLEHHKNNPTIFTDNVRLIYKNDSLLDYVQLVEYADYTTAKYNIGNGSDTTDIEIPYEIYYWYIVHPIATHEAPFYINPRLQDSSHYGLGETAPPTGKFWRDYLFNYPDTAEKTVVSEHPDNKDTIYVGTISPILRDRLSGEKLLYNGKIDNSDNNGAIGKLTEWVKEVMVFAASSNDVWKGERGWQTVRIYHMHRGRCGEHASITCAAGRSALIPMNSPYDITRDHTWNEWYDTDWHQWEPSGTMINNTGHYESWGWEFRELFCFRGDGYLWDVTPRYTPHCTLTVTIRDANDRPADGARAYLYSPMCYDSTNIYYSGKRFADSDGRVDFLIGDNMDFYINVKTDDSRGIYPASGMVKIIDNSVVGQHYNWTCNLPGTQPVLSVSQGNLVDTTKYFKIDVNFGVSQEIIRGKTLFANELRNRACWQRFGYYTDLAKNIEFFICNAAEFSKYQNGSAFEAFEIRNDADSGDVSFICPNDEWYVVFSTKDLVENEEVVNLNINLYVNTNAVEEISGQLTYFNVQPSPFRDCAYIDFMVPQAKSVQIGLYDLSGRCVKEIVKGKMSGKQHMKIDGDGIGAGMYFIRFDDGKKITTRKIVKI